MEIEKHTYHPITGGLVVPQKPIFQMVEALNTLGIKELQHIDASHQGFFERCTNGNNLLANGNGRILNVSDFIKPNDKGPVYADEGITLQSVR